MDVKWVKCNLCGADSPITFLARDKLRIVRCKKCGLMYTNPQPTEEEIKNIYSANYYKSDNSIVDGYDDYFSDRDNIEWTSIRRLKQIKGYKNQGRILDIGCAGGFFLNIARQRGWSTYGIDISDYAANYAKEKLNLNVIVSNLKEANFPARFFDVVTMWDVIEHLSDPLGELIEVNKVLKDNGIVVIMAPNTMSVIAQITGKRWLLYKRDDHLFHFSPQSLSRMMEKAGLKTIKCSQWGLGGKRVSIKFIFNRLKEYNHYLFGFALKVVRWLGISNISIYADIGDNMVIYAKKS